MLASPRYLVSNNRRVALFKSTYSLTVLSRTLIDIAVRRLLISSSKNAFYGSLTSTSLVDFED